MYKFVNIAYNFHRPMFRMFHSNFILVQTSTISASTSKGEGGVPAVVPVVFFDGTNRFSAPFPWNYIYNIAWSYKNISGIKKILAMSIKISIYWRYILTSVNSTTCFLNRAPRPAPPARKLVPINSRTIAT